MPHASFDFVAPYYDRLANLIFGNAIKKSQTIFTDSIPPKIKILIIGGGSGWILEEVLKQAPQARVVYLEASNKMLDLAKLQFNNNGYLTQIEFRLGTETSITANEQFDVIISNFFLDLFAPLELQDISNILHNHLLPGGTWLVTDFIQPKGLNLKTIYSRILYKSMYIFFRLTCNITARHLPDWENLLLSYRLIPFKSAYFYGGLIKSVVYKKPQAM